MLTKLRYWNPSKRFRWFLCFAGQSHDKVREMVYALRHISASIRMSLICGDMISLTATHCQTA